MDSIELRASGVSGTLYLFKAHPWGTRFPAIPGLYAFVAPLPTGLWRVLYLGETHDLDERVGLGLRSHHRALDALHRGATHVAVARAPAVKGDRLAQETDLCEALMPPCNGMPHKV